MSICNSEFYGSGKCQRHFRLKEMNSKNAPPTLPTHTHTHTHTHTKAVYTNSCKLPFPDTYCVPCALVYFNLVTNVATVPFVWVFSTQIRKVPNQDELVTQPTITIGINIRKPQAQRAKDTYELHTAGK